MQNNSKKRKLPITGDSTRERFTNGFLTRGEKLGEGIYSNVYYGLWSKDGNETDVAIKYGTESNDLNAVEIIENEIRIMRLLPLCSHFPELICHVGITLVMTYIEGCTLESMIGHRDIDFKTRLHILKNASQNLYALHQAGFIHRDIKSSNFMVRVDHSTVLIDFGFALLMQETNTVRKMVGTRLYMAPEIYLLRRPPSKEADIYALALLAYELGAHENAWRGVESLPQLRQALEQSQRPSLSILQYRSAALILLLHALWRSVPSNRMSLEQVDAVLTVLLASETLQSTSSVKSVIDHIPQFGDLTEVIISALEEKNADLLAVIMNDALLTSDCLTRCVTREGKRFSFILELIREGDISTLDYFLNKFPITAAMLTLTDDFSHPNGLLWECASRGLLPQLKKLLDSPALQLTHFNLLFANGPILENHSWQLKCTNIINDQIFIEQAKIQRIASTIFLHPLMTLGHFKRFLIAIHFDQSKAARMILFRTIHYQFWHELEKGGNGTFEERKLQSFQSMLATTLAKTDVSLHQICTEIKNYHQQWSQGATPIQVGVFSILLRHVLYLFTNSASPRIELNDLSSPILLSL